MLRFLQSALKDSRTEREQGLDFQACKIEQLIRQLVRDLISHQNSEKYFGFSCFIPTRSLQEIQRHIDVFKNILQESEKESGDDTDYRPGIWNHYVSDILAGKNPYDEKRIRDATEDDKVDQM